MDKRLYIFLLVLCFFAATLSGQEEQRKFNRFSVNDGLSQSAIFDILQDSTGYLWFATADGLNRYDGYQFTHLKHNPNNSNSLPDNYVNVLLEDSRGYLWIGTFGGGLTRFDRTRHHFQHYLKHTEGAGLPGNYIMSLAEDAQGNVWVGTQQGLGLIDTAGTVSSFAPAGGHPVTINDIEPDSAGFLWLATSQGVQRFFPQQEEFEAAPLFTSELQQEEVVQILRDQDGRLWFGMAVAGLVVYEPESGIFHHLHHQPGNAQSLSDNRVASLLEAQDGDIWIGTLNGLNRYHPESGRFSSYFHDPYDPRSLSSNEVISLYQDRSGVLWVGTFGGGLNNHYQHNEHFVHYQNVPRSEHGLAANSVFALHEDQTGKIWVGTDGGGLNSIELIRNGKGEIMDERFHAFRHDPEVPTSISSDKVWAVTGGHADELWIGTLGGGLNRLDLETGHFTQFRASSDDTTSISDDYIYSLWWDSDSVLWLGTDFGLDRFNPETGTSRHFPVEAGSDKRFSSNAVFTIYEDKKGRLWVGSFGGGLNLFDRKTQRWGKQYLKVPGHNGSLSNNKVMFVREDSHGHLWVGTFGGGLNLFLPEKEQFLVFSENEGLPNDVVYGMEEDSAGNLWLSTNKGLSRFEVPKEITSMEDVQPGMFTNFDWTDNLQSNEFNQGAYLEASDGRLYFGGIHGLNAFYPKEVQPNPYVPEVHIQMFRGLDERVHLHNRYNEQQQVVLPWTENFITFKFTAFNYVNPQKNHFAYKLEGLNEDWVYSGTHRYATFTNLDPGEYVLRVMASNNSGVWNTYAGRVKLFIQPPFWRAPWFLPSLSLTVVLVVGLLVYLVVKNVKETSRSGLMQAELRLAQAEGESTKARLASLRAQMNPHFLFNSLNSIQHYIARNEKEVARDYLSTFSTLMRRILNNSSQDRIPLEDELETLELYLELESMRFDNKFDYTINVSPEVEVENTEVPPLLLQPYVENAVQHGLMNKAGKGRLLVEIRQEGKDLHCVVEDNGIGRKKAREIKERKEQRYASMGMEVNRSRLEIINRHSKAHPAVRIIDLKDHEGNALGTRVEIRIPLEESLIY